MPYTYRDSGNIACCKAAGIEAERHYVGGDVLDYWRLMCHVWADGEDFILCEHDIQFPPDAIRLLEACPGVHCNAAPWFRLVRFRAEIMRAIPDAFERMAYVDRHWIPLEWEFNCALEADPRTVPFRHDIHDHSSDFFGRIYNPVYAERVAGNTSMERSVHWAAWMRGLPDDIPDSLVKLPNGGGEVTWREWAWTIARGHPRNTPDWPCSHENCKRGNGSIDRCPQCVERPSVPFRDADGTWRKADGTKLPGLME